MINQRVFLNVLDENQKPITKCKVKIENQREKYEGETDFAGIVEFLVPLGIYALTIDHDFFKKKVYRMTLRDGFSFTRIILQRNKRKREEEEIPIVEHNDNNKIDMNSEPLKPRSHEKVEINQNTDLEERKEDSFIQSFNNEGEILKSYFEKENLFNEANIWGATGMFNEINEGTFEEIIKGAKSMLEEILNFANSFDGEDFNYDEVEGSYNFNHVNKEINNLEEKINNINEKMEQSMGHGIGDYLDVDEIKEEGEPYSSDTYDIDDYEEEVFEEINK